MWTVGKGFTADKRTTNILDKIRGWGKDTFDGVLQNQIGVRHVNGDSYAEIITPDGEELKSNGSNLINLKPFKSKKHRPCNEPPGNFRRIQTKKYGWHRNFI